MKNKLLPFLAVFFLCFIFASPFLTKGKVAFPSTYQLEYFAPQSTYREFAGPVKNNAQPDIITQIYPWRYFDIQEIKKGHFPFWNPYSFAGTPHLANYQSAVLFPLNILFFLPFSFINIWSLLVILQPLLAGFGMLFLMKKFGVSKAGSIISSFSFMFCGFIVTWMGYATLGYAILPLPFAFFTVLKYVETKKHKWLIFLSLTFLFSFFSGHFQTSIYFSLAVFGFILYRFIFFEEKQAYIEAFLFSIFGLLLAMPQILPSIEFYSESVRSNLFQKMEAIPWNYLPTLLSPDYYGNPVTRNDWFGHYAEWNGFSGGIVLTLGIFTIIFKRSKTTWFFIILALLSLLCAYNTPLLSLIVALKVPVLSTSAASRIIVLFSFSIAVLSGFGYDELLTSAAKHRRNIIVWGAGILCLLLAVGLLSFSPILQQDKMLIARKNFILPCVLTILFLVSLVPFLILKNKKYVHTFMFVTLLLVGFEMYRFASKWQSFDSKDLANKTTPIASFYNNLNRIDRALGPSEGEDAVYYNVPALSGYDPLYSARYGEFVQYVGSGELKVPERSVVTFPFNGKFTPQAINFLGVKYIVHKISDGTFAWAFPFNKYPLPHFSKIYDDSFYQVFRNNESSKRAFIVSNLAVLNKPEEILDYMFSNDLQKTAVVEEKLKDVNVASTGEAAITEYLPNKIIIKTKTNGTSMLVLTDNFYPGWKVSVNGERSKIYRTDYTFRGVVVPKGDSTIEFSYIPESFLVGIYLTLLGCLGIIMSIIIKYFQFKK